MQEVTTDVLIVGAGPVGLTAAIVLTQHGHDVTVIDRQAEGVNTSRAAVVHSHTLELLEPYGVADDLVARGVHTPTFTIRDRDDLLIAVPFSDLPTRYPYTLMISQADTEAFLLNRLEQLGGKVLRPATVTEIRQSADHATARFADGQQIRARYLIGADGMHSTVREQAGIAFSGGTYGESFTLADARLSGGVPADEVILYFSPAGLVVVAPLPDRMYRIVATVGEAPQHPDIAFVQALLDERGPVAQPATVEEVVWGSRFRVHHRVADTFRDNRVLLAGDAAHVHSPAGGQGMNLGIEDAVVLGERLSRVLHGGDDDPSGTGLLDEYAATRRQTARSIVAMTSRLTDLATASARSRPIRNRVMRLAGKLPAVRRALAWRLSGLDRR
ncbi:MULTISPECIES: NAD(P)/FAD-dependent oxidoreductase [unclassified Mycolicibacterium]|uniref:FAD-dependent oxidoreductase n=1 Tax=unclassified Mycolicibacterium TaxID=2636767 RepID=UPI0012DFCD06|nr:MULTISPECIES: NAD(P)/FAD-dependent oxidoreductase [unclassified Mycolicibacterium]MUL81121.1 FAD-dependent monooxygenase [Mycolicibacterium sp. CBMA 329]MUL86887.1 FAD-dependent monooxygenase [Mycolicibacterium sp. CBMA 331]MUL98829.1 FAD-dependent monooxygenase [Mycolicibacterium sp. CBMA 334]MUM29098.1 FAD-dependent monooxygenase [Mycolicibacterium sp. CBMA 295]MUM37184.1 FAD-dependent monooxygenase [Mycolicibacterium sp. CBMA 247]